MNAKTLLISIAGIVLASCAGLKKKDRPKYDLMDNLTSRYNIIHHGRIMIADAEQQNREMHRENYRHLLPVFIEPNELSGPANAPLMDSVVGKARRVINEKTNGKYVNEAWFLTGKAHYLKGNYYNAAEYFSYVVGITEKFPKLQQQARIWHARSLMQLEATHAAEEILDSVVAGLERHKRSRAHAKATLARYHLQRGEEKQAITALSQALDYRGKTADKLRWHYLLAQLLERHNYRQDAIKHYRRVTRSNVNYEMAFNASLNRLFLETRGHPDERQQLRAFQSMLRDDKNKEFRDQILFYLGETHYRYGHFDEAIALFNRSLGAASANRYQKATTYMRLADHYFENREFPDARGYYDSAAMVLPVDYPDVEPVRRKLSSIAELITHLQTIEHQDSLQYLGSMDEWQRNQVIDTIITDRYAVLAAAAAEQANRSRRRQPVSPQDIGISPFDQVWQGENIQAYTDNRFYFNNPDAIGMGMSTFRRTWGNRESRDNWRWGSALTGSDSEGTSASYLETTTAHDADGGTYTEAENGLPDSLQFAAMIRKHYESNLPLAPEQLDASHQQIKTALERIGELYRYGLADSQAAANSYLELLERYTSDPARAAWLYQLVITTGVDEPKAAQYKATLLTEFPESRYSKTLIDPNYLRNVADEKKQLAGQYHDVYQQYLDGSYEQIIKSVDHLIADGAELAPAKQDEHRSIYAQLAYLRALAIGRIAEPAAFKGELEKLVSRFATDSLVTPLAKQHLVFMETYADEIAGRTHALLGAEHDSLRFVDEPALMRWPQLVIHSRPEQDSRDTRIFENAGTRGLPPEGGANRLTTLETLERREIGRQVTAKETPPPRRPAGSTRDLTVLPDLGTYYFVINVMHPRVNLAPSRFGIGQFNRTRYTGQTISHQLKLVEDEAQLIYVGPFSSYQEAKTYESRILPMMTDIMKVPEDIYNTFLITESIFGTLSDFEKVDDYVIFYRGQ